MSSLNIKLLICSLSLLLFSGCSTLESHPLIFGSHNSFGVQIAWSETTGPAINAGYDSNDVSIVPTIFAGKIDQVVLAVRGCYAKGKNVKQVSDCNVDIYSGTEFKNSQKNLQTTSTVFQSSESGFYQDSFKIEKALAQDDSVFNENDQAKQSIKDSLSVFSSFEAATDAASKSAGLNLGKMYATGAAAQHLTEGIGIKLQREGNGANAQAVTACVSKLSEIFGDQLKPEDTKICQGQLLKDQ